MRIDYFQGQSAYVKAKFCACVLAGLFLYLLLITPIAADVIYLKNGKQLQADRVWEEGDQVCYERDGNEYRFSKTLVVRIEQSPGGATALPAADASSRTNNEKSELLKGLPAPTQLKPDDSADAIAGLITNGKINNDMLWQLESAARSGPDQAAAKKRYLIALSNVIELQINQGNQADAIRNLQKFLTSDPANLRASLVLATLYLHHGQYAQAEECLDHVKNQNDKSPELHQLLGTTYYWQERNDLASKELRRSLELKRDPQVQQLLKKIESENHAEDSFAQANSLHFIVRYEGSDNNHALGAEILNTLEKAYAELESALDYSPRQSIAVVLYPNEVFQDVTQAPQWAGALNDGKIRLPLKGITRVDATLAMMLKHELTHSFLHLKTASKCPVWLQEGLAQYLSGESATAYLSLFKQAAQAGQLFSLEQMEGSFTSLSAASANVAYKESLLAVEFLVKNYGMDAILRLLNEDANSADFNAALKASLHTDRTGLQREFEQFVLQS